MRRRILNRAGIRTARPRAQLRQGRTDWYAIRNAASPVAEVLIYDEIGYWGVTAADFVRELQGVTAPAIELRINSPGGEVFDGIAIMNAIRSHPATVTAYVDGLAASAASFILQAADTRIMRPQSQLMIHDAMGLCVGNGADMRQMADELDRISDTIASVYAERGDGTVARWRDRMRAETWYGADEAVAAGLADQVATNGASTNRMPRRENTWDLTIFGTDGRTGGPADDATPAARESVAVVARTAPAPDPVEEAAAHTSTGPAPDTTPDAPDTADVPLWSDDLAAVFRDALRPPDESDLAAAFRDALAEPDPDLSEVVLIDPIEFYNAVREASL